jgi:hypothetical protein
MWSLRRAVRVIVQAPLVAVAIVLLTSVGVASVLSIFGPLYSLILSPLPLPEPDRSSTGPGARLRMLTSGFGRNATATIGVDDLRCSVACSKTKRSEYYGAAGRT